MVYKWKTGSVIKADAQVAGEVCKKLEETDGLTAPNLVNVSRPEDAPLHDYFEWNDAIAAELYREVEAGKIIRSIVVEVEDVKEEPVRAFFTLDSKYKGHSTFESIRTIMVQTEKRNSLLDIALKELKAFERKYRMLSELASVFEAIDKLEVKGDD